MHSPSGTAPAYTPTRRSNAIVEELRPEPGELVVNKVSRSAFTATGLENVLRNMGVEQLVIGGGATHACVESTGRSASDLGFQVAVVDDACISQFPLLHEATMINFHMSMGRVVGTQEGLGGTRSRGGPAVSKAGNRVRSLGSRPIQHPGFCTGRDS